MSDDDLNDVLDQYTTEPEWVTQTEKERLISTGTYEGQGQRYTTRQGDRDPFLGTYLVLLQVELYNVDGEPSRMHFFDVCPRPTTYSNGKQTVESRLWTDLATATETVGKPARETMTQFTLTRLAYKLRYSPARERDGRRYKARTWTDAITAVKG